MPHDDKCVPESKETGETTDLEGATGWSVSGPPFLSSRFGKEEMVQERRAEILSQLPFCASHCQAFDIDLLI